MRFIPPPEENAICYSGELPKVYSSFQLPLPDTHRTEGDFGTVISQYLKADNFAIWKHDFLIKRPVVLYPYVPESVYTLNYMLKGCIPCELVGFGKIELKENTYNLYHVPPVKQYAWLSTGEFSCLHIDLKPGALEELAIEFDPLKEFLKLTVDGKASVVRASNYTMDGSIKLILNDIMHCKETGARRILYCRSCIYNLLLIFIQDLLAGDETEPVLQVDASILKEVQQYLLENYSLPITIDGLCRRFGISKTSLKQKFKAQFNVTVHQFLTQKRMQVGVELLDKKMKVCKVAEAVGYSDPSSFAKAFIACYGCSPYGYNSQPQDD